MGAATCRGVSAVVGSGTLIDMVDWKNIAAAVFLLFTACASAAAPAPEAVCPPMPAAVDAAPTEVSEHDQGLLWRIHAAGVAPSYLFGTIHLADPRVIALAETVRAAFDESEVLVAELELHPLARTQIAQASLLPADTDSIADRAPEVFGVLEDLAWKEFRLRKDDLLRLKPWAVFTLLSRPHVGSGKVLDEVLQDRASERGYEIIGLETAPELVAVLDGISTPDQIEILRDTVCNYEELKQQVAELVGYYLAGDLAAMWAINSRPHHDEAVYARFIDRILTQRNRRMLERLRGPLARGRLFIAVGALHLPGEEGLLRGVEDMGYQLEKVY